MSSWRLPKGQAWNADEVSHSDVHNLTLWTAKKAKAVFDMTG